MKTAATVKLETAAEVRNRLMQLCLEHCRAPDQNNLVKIGAYLGDFANNLRSSLNYTIYAYAEARLKADLPPQEYRKIEKKLDFPCRDTRDEFDQMPTILHIRNHDKRTYEFLERAQPYHRGNDWLRRLFDISNRDKHIVTAEIRSAPMSAVTMLRADKTITPQPQFFGVHRDKMIVVDGETFHVHSLPCYYFPYGAFAVEGGKWVFFFVPIDGQRSLGLTRFTETVHHKTKITIDEFHALL